MLSGEIAPKNNHYYYYHTHTKNVTFTLRQQTPHGSTLLLVKPSFVLLLMTITLVFPKLNVQPYALKTRLPFSELIYESLKCLTHQESSAD